MIPILRLKNGKWVYLEGSSVTKKEALEIADRLIALWGQILPQAKAVMLYEVSPQWFSPCPHYQKLADGLESEGYPVDAKVLERVPEG